MIRIKLLPGEAPKKVSKNQINYTIIVADLKDNPIDTLYINHIQHYIFGADKKPIDVYVQGTMSMRDKILNFFGDPFNTAIDEFLTKHNMVWDEDDRKSRFEQAHKTTK